MQARLLSPEELSSYWELVRPLLAEAHSHGLDETPLSTHLARALNWQSQVWVAIDDDNKIAGAMLTTFLQYTNYKTLQIVLFTGEGFKGYSELFSVIEEWALKSGCKAIEQWGRRGWSKVLPKVVPGFEEAYVVMRKELKR
jgi:hypothetical protein